MRIRQRIAIHPANTTGPWTRRQPNHRHLPCLQYSFSLLRISHITFVTIAQGREQGRVFAQKVGGGLMGQETAKKVCWVKMEVGDVGAIAIVVQENAQLTPDAGIHGFINCREQPLGSGVEIITVTSNYRPGGKRAGQSPVDKCRGTDFR